MTIPALVFGILLSTAYGTAFHFIKGGPLNHLLLYVILAWLGFWTGHVLGGLVGWTFLASGPLNIGTATLAALIFLMVGDWLSRIEVTRNQ